MDVTDMTLTPQQQDSIENAAFALRLALVTDKNWIAKALRRLPAERRKDAIVFFSMSGANLDLLLGKVKNAVFNAAEEALQEIVYFNQLRKAEKRRRASRREPGYGRAVGL